MPLRRKTAMVRNPMNKYGAKKSFGYDSNAERDYSEVLDLYRKGKIIRAWDHHPPAIKWSTAKWNVDFLITARDGQEFYIEYKGCETDYYKLKLKWFLSMEPIPAPLVIIKGSKSTGFAEYKRYGMEGIPFP